MLKAAKATCDFYIENSCTDGIPYWDTGAPGLSKMGDYLNKPAIHIMIMNRLIVRQQRSVHRVYCGLGKYLQNKGDD